MTIKTPSLDRRTFLSGTATLGAGAMWVSAALGLGAFAALMAVRAGPPPPSGAPPCPHTDATSGPSSAAARP